VADTPAPSPGPTSGSGPALSDADILRCVDATVLGVLLPAIPPDAAWARAAAIQLVGLVRYAAQRCADQTAARTAEVADTLTALGGNQIVAAVWDGDRARVAVSAAASAALVAAVGRDDTAADEVRDVLRPVLVRHLDDDRHDTAPLVEAFRGKLDG
jgi:hypothetical protein